MRTQQQILIALSFALCMAPKAVKAAEWERVITCQSPAGTIAWIDVDATERRNLQIVIRDPNAIRYLSSLDVTVASRKENSELTIGFRQKDGVFKASDFSFADSQDAYDAPQAVKVGDEYMTKYTNLSYLYRDGKGVKVEFARSAMEICNFFDPNTGTCVGGRTHYVRDRYIGNWFFSDCR